jgi:HlyD family secretion protein
MSRSQKELTTMPSIAAPIAFERAHNTTPIRLASAAVGLVFFLGFGGWAVTAPLRGATVAPATVAPESHRKTIQHLEGGIIREFMVREGSTVAAGDVLLRLDDTQLRAEMAQLQTRLVSRRAELGRLKAEQAGAAEPAFDDDLREAARSRSEVAEALAAEITQMRVRRASLASQIAVLTRRAAGERETIAGHEASIASYGEQIALIDEEIRTVEALLQKGLERKPRLLTLLRDHSELVRATAASRSDIARAREAIAQAKEEIRALIETRGAEVAAAMVEAQTEAAELKEEIGAGFDKLARTWIRAPSPGTIVNLRFKTQGGVVGPGEAILDLIPDEDRLVLEARVAPNDIDDVEVGLAAQVHLVAYRQRSLPQIEGVVDYVSADRLADDKTGESYYAARISIAREQLAALGPQIVLTPGMPAEALIMMRERTLFDYLLAPVADTFRRGLREA